MRVRTFTAGLLQVLLYASVFGVAGYALVQIIRGGSVVNFIAWFALAAVLHDLVLLPAYSLLDRVARASGPRRPAPRVPWINHVRAPALVSGLLLLVYFPAIFGISDRNYFLATGHHLEGYARNWLEITAVLFAISALLYLLRVLRARAR
jgi:hypothetical protein